MTRELLQTATPTKGWFFEVTFVTEPLVDTPCEFQGFTDGSTWNGFANIWVTPTVFEKIVDDCHEELSDGMVDTLQDQGFFDLGRYVEEDTGFISLANGWATHLLNEKGGKP